MTHSSSHDGIPADLLPDCIWRMDLDLRLRDASPAAEAMFGIPAAALRGSPLADHTTGADHARLSKLVAQALAAPDRTAALIHETRIRHADGRLIPVEVHSRLLLDADGRPVEILGIARDISSRRARERRDRRREQARLEDQKLDALARLAGAAAEAIDPLLAGDDDPAARDHAARFMDRLRVLAGQRALEPEDLDVDALVAGVLAALRPAQPAAVELVHQPGAGGSTVRADRALVELAVTGLVRRACRAIGGSGLVTVITGLRPADPTPDAPPAAPVPPWITVEVRDTGPGLDHAARERILEPVQPDEPLATSMELAMVRSVAVQHQGRLEVESRPGDGAAFRLLLPARFADDWQAAASPAVGAATPTILLVDDDPEIRTYCERVLRSGGYAVTSCADGAEALAVIAGGEAIDAVVLDWALPGLDGRRVFEQIIRRQPRLPLLVISGHASKDYQALGGIDTETPWLAKPFTPPALLAAVARLLPDRAEAPGS